MYEIIDRIKQKGKIEDILGLLEESRSSFCIYGAGIVAASVYTAIKTLCGCMPCFFLISDSEAADLDEPKERHVFRHFQEINGIPVKTLSEWKEGGEIPEKYVVAAPEVHHAAIVRALRELRIEDEKIFLFTNERENELMEKYYRMIPGHRTIRGILAGQKALEKALTLSEKELFSDIVHVYQAKSHMDRPVQSQSIMPAYICPVQVGASLTEQIICELQDNSGENISTKNRNYCELTASYYAWRHSDDHYKGICHYRRLFDIDVEQMCALLCCATEWDVILPYPSVHYPDISSQHSRYIKESDWKAMLQALGELEPAYLEAYEKNITNGEQYFFNFNMLIAKAEVFDEYCSFLFRVLERTEELVTPKGWERADRFAGYLGENLTTMYFLKNRERWKIAYAGKIWLT